MTHQYTHYLGFSLLIIAISMAWFVPIAEAHENHSSVRSNTSVSASTGGNTAESGEVVEGQSTGSVHVETVVNGETVESFKKTFEGMFDFNEVFKHESEHVRTETRVEAQATGNSQSTTNNQQSTTNNPQPTTDNERPATNQVNTNKAVETEAKQRTIMKSQQTDTEDANVSTEESRFAEHPQLPTTEESSRVRSSFSVKTFLSNLFNHVFNIFK